MLKEEVVVLSLEDKLDGEKLKSYVYGSDLKANTIWVWLILFIFIFVTVMLLKNDIAIWLCALCGAIIGGFTGYNQPTYLGITNKGNLIVSKFKLDNAVNLDDVSINSPLITINNALDIETKEIDDKDYKKVINGAVINNNYNIKDKVLFIKDNKVIAIYQNINDKLKCFKMML